MYHISRKKAYLEGYPFKVQNTNRCFTREGHTCDSGFIKNCIEEIGQSTRYHFSHVPKTTLIHIFMDDDSRYGKTKVKVGYEKFSKTKFNIVIE